MGRGKYSEESDNFKGKLLVSILIMVVLAVATGVLVITAPAQENGLVEWDLGINIPGDDGTTSIYTDPTDPTYPDEFEDPYDYVPYVEPAILSASVLFFGSARPDRDFTLEMGTSAPLRLRIISEGMDEDDYDITWESSDRTVFDVVASDTTGLAASLTPIGIGTAYLRVTINGETFEYVGRIRR